VKTAWAEDLPTVLDGPRLIDAMVDMEVGNAQSTELLHVVNQMVWLTNEAAHNLDGLAESIDAAMSDHAPPAASRAAAHWHPARHRYLALVHHFASAFWRSPVKPIASVAIHSLAKRRVQHAKKCRAPLYGTPDTSDVTRIVRIMVRTIRWPQPTG
jgi:hypothetical protein